MEKLVYSTGIREFQVEGGVLRFSPTDTAFMERLFTCFTQLEKKQDSVEHSEADLQDPVSVFKKINVLEAEMRDCIDAVFGKDACEKIFPGIGLYARAEGMPVWANFLFAVMDLMETSAADEQKKVNPRIQFYRKKYGKYMKKK